MSNTSTFAVGLGSGLALWYLTKPESASNSTPKGEATRSSEGTKARRNCAVRIDLTGLTADGARVDATEAVRRCIAAGGAEVTVAPNAPASTYAELMDAFGARETPTVRNARRKKATRIRTRRNRDTSSTFTLAIYPKGIQGATKRVSWFRTDQPITWQAARDQLVAAGIIDAQAVSPNSAGYWRLTTEPSVFDADEAKPLPNGARRQRDASRAALRYTREGRTILRDGEPIVYLDRVDLGDQRYAISPHHADLLTMRLVHLLNRHGA